MIKLVGQLHVGHSVALSALLLFAGGWRHAFAWSGARLEATLLPGPRFKTMGAAMEAILLGRVCP